jgi:Leucine-rich repeat (LRR) protein
MCHNIIVIYKDNTNIEYQLSCFKYIRNNCISIKYENNNIDTLKLNFNKFKDLKQLSFKNNELTSTPNILLMPNNLENLDLSLNYIEEINNDINNLNNLKILNLSGNVIQFLPTHNDGYGHDNLNLPNLEILMLNNCDIEYISDDYFTNLMNLKNLNIDSNELTELPKEISNLSKLKELSIYDNKLIKIPLSFAKIKDAILDE